MWSVSVFGYRYFNLSVLIFRRVLSLFGHIIAFTIRETSVCYVSFFNLKRFDDDHTRHYTLRMLNILERYSVVAAAYIVTSSHGLWLDQSGGDAGFKRSGNSGVRSRAARVIVRGSLVSATPAMKVKVTVLTIWNSPIP